MENVYSFDDINNLPLEVQRVILLHSNDDETYYNCEELKKKLEVFGFTCDYGLDAIAYDLRKIDFEL